MGLILPVQRIFFLSKHDGLKNLIIDKRSLLDLTDYSLFFTNETRIIIYEIFLTIKIDPIPRIVIKFQNLLPAYGKRETYLEII